MLPSVSFSAEWNGFTIIESVQSTYVRSSTHDTMPCGGVQLRVESYIVVDYSRFSDLAS